MRTWLATRKNIPPATKAMLAEQGRERRAKVSAQVPEEGETGSSIGAPAALKRLENGEVAAYGLLQSALKGGDPSEIKATREGWLKVGDSLRRYDLLVESQRRESGEMVNRSEVEQHIQNFFKWFKLALVRSTSALASELASMTAPAEIEEALRRAYIDNTLSALVTLASARSPAKVPEWLLNAAVRPIADAVTIQ